MHYFRIVPKFTSNVTFFFLKKKKLFHCIIIVYLRIPRIGSPLCTATLLFMRSTAAAPSLTWLAFPEIKER
jgi:hypothetical protein